MKCILYFLSFFSILSVNAQKLENSTLWKISGNNLETPSYLFGTIHITCDASIDIDVKKALEETTQIVLELDMDDPSIQQKMMANIYMKDGKTLKDLVSEEELKTIDAFFLKNAGIPINAVQNVKPFFLYAMLFPKMLDCPIQSYELELTKIAKAQKEEIKGLETTIEQTQVFDVIPYKDQIADLLKAAKDDLEADKNDFKKMLELYNSENITAMYNYSLEDKEHVLSKYTDVLLHDRNKNWIPKIENFAKSQPTFFGVGAAHLAGKKGLIQLLKDAGYTVTAVQ